LWLLVVVAVAVEILQVLVRVAVGVLVDCCQVLL
jgi:hypothetical protein